MKYLQTYNSAGEKALHEISRKQIYAITCTIAGIMTAATLYGLVQYLLRDKSPLIFAVIAATDILYIVSVFMALKNLRNRAVMLTTFVLSASIIYCALTDPGQTGYFFALSLPVMTANLTVRARGLVFISLINSGIIMLFGWLSPSLGISETVNPVIFINVVTALIIISRKYREWLEEQKEKSLIETRNATIFAVAFQAEMRDQTTGRHLERTSKYVFLLASALKDTPEFSSYITGDYIKDLAQASILHDIGKVGIPDSILLKPDRLTDDEFEQIKGHCRLGKMIIDEALSRLHSRSVFDLAEQIVLSHHEKWDGSGYPEGLTGENIPLSARIMALADVYDALRTLRPYKLPLDHDTSRDIIVSGKGSHFDPLVVDAFLKVEEHFRKFSEHPGDSSKIN